MGGYIGIMEKKMETTKGRLPVHGIHQSFSPLMSLACGSGPSSGLATALGGPPATKGLQQRFGSATRPRAFVFSTGL